ncbi:PREDICTED: zinc finger protein 1 homolog isoform X1 [Nicrophorus vespilloides]|uniref:Zinc finger protein 1 homolog isoform X1 n=2 Tax=Nicrophorus vespilloides TaxID=110193 RepID=A0ABM1N8U8_NICVS|nr:PREDICTED: zinc finger protein 1 homolog isoform X1 [Nicrophorus vespilloides]
MNQVVYLCGGGRENLIEEQNSREIQKDVMEASDRELLSNVTITSDENGSQYMIQRMTVENAQLLSSDLLHHPNGLVVDLGGDFIPVNYSEDLLGQELTEEDRNLAAALVAVQFSQQQKQQQTQQDGSVIINTTLPSLGSLDGSKVTLGDQQVLLADKQTGYLQIVDADNLYKQADFDYDDSTSIQLIKAEEEETTILHKDSDVDNRDQRTAKKSLPHKKRISRKLKKRMQKCNFCDQLVNVDEFADHQVECEATITPIPNMFSCQICKANFSEQLEFFEHLKVHYEPTEKHESQVVTSASSTIITTSVIPTLASDDIKESPMKLEQEPQKDSILASLLQITCFECKKYFRRQKTYEQHMREFHNKVDLNEFSEPEDLMAGIDVNAAEVDDDDNKTWYQDELHATEEDLKELEAKEHVCQNCQQPFPIRAILMQHLVTCTETQDSQDKVEVKDEVKKKKAKKPELECDVCNRKFTHRNSLVYHQRSHTGNRPHQCEQCGKSFFASSALKVHLRLHSGDKPYRCEFCGRNFRQWGDLKYHCISIHTDEKQYQCEYCGKDFARKYSLIVHRRIHTGEKNYRCEFCGKTFRASSYLQNHRRIHTGEKPHPCEVCGKRFRVRSDMKRHLRTHTRRRNTRTITLPIGSELKMEEEHEIPQESEDTNESIMKEENEVAVQSLQYEQETLETVRDGNTLYVMPILIS